MELEDLKQKVFEMVATSQKKVKPGDLARTLARLPGVNKQEVKEAISALVSEKKLIYTYTQHTWLEIPPDMK
jgi:hypothetical protein